MQAAWDAVAGRYEVVDLPGYCLMAARQVVERALAWPDRGLYDLLGGYPKAEPRHEGWWARDAEKILRALGWAVAEDEREAGDLAFNYRAAPLDPAHPEGPFYGHVGVLVHRDWVFENAPGRRGVTVRRALKLSPLSAWGGVTTVIRMRDRPLG